MYAVSWVGPGRTHQGQTEIPLSAEEDTRRSRMADCIRDRNCVTVKDMTFFCKFVVKYFVVTLLLKYVLAQEIHHIQTVSPCSEGLLLNVAR